jgi:aspartate ammonia-lyase
MQVMGNDVVIGQACAGGSLELNAFMPIITANLLESIELLTTACDIFCRGCVDGITANREHCRKTVENATATATALLPRLGYDLCAEIAKQAAAEKKTIRQIVLERKLLSEAEFDALISPEAVCQLGQREKGKGQK